MRHELYVTGQKSGRMPTVMAKNLLEELVELWENKLELM